jgi:hypothetical protein
MADAEKAKNYDGQRIWACDRKKTDGSLGKFFVVKSPFEFFLYQVDPRNSEHMNWYEIIGKDSPCCLHFDVEVGVVSKDAASCFDDAMLGKRLDFLGIPNDKKVSLLLWTDLVSPTYQVSPSDLVSPINLVSLTLRFPPCPLLSFQVFLVKRYREVCSDDWDNKQCVFVYRFLMACVHDFCNRKLGLEFQKKELKVLSACRSQKCSFHVMVPGVVLDRNYISCRYLSWEFARYFWVRLGNNLLANSTWGSPTLAMDVFLRLGMLEKQSDDTGWMGVNDSPVDEVIYSRSRQFRLVGMSKLGGLPMIEVVKEKDMSVMSIGLPGWRMRGVLTALGYEGWLSYLVCPLVPTLVASYSTSPYFPFRVQVGRAFEGLFGASSLKSKW